MDIPKIVVDIISATQRTKDLQKELVATIRKYNPTLEDGVLTLLLMAIGHMKDSDFPKEDFMTLCDIIWEGSATPSDEQEIESIN